MSTGQKLLDAAYATKNSDFFQRRAQEAITADAEARKLRPGDPGYGLSMMQVPSKTPKGT